MIGRWNWLVNFDLFKSPVNFYFKGDDFGSIFGGMATILMAIVLTVIFFPTLQDFFQADNFTY
jgi:hypothetical protein